MPTANPASRTSRVLKARLAVAKRDRPDADDTTALQREFIASRLADHIEAVVSGAPPLTDEQLSRLRNLLRPSTGDGGPDGA